MLMSDDLPTLLRPMKAMSFRSSFGTCEMRSDEHLNSALVICIGLWFCAKIVQSLRRTKFSRFSLPGRPLHFQRITHDGGQDDEQSDGSEIPIKAIDDIGRATAEDVREALHQVIDPELGIDVIDLGLVYGIEIDELGRAIITMTLTTPACPLTDLIEDECASTLAGLVEEFRIDWTWDPRWTMERITPEGRDQLAALGFNFDNMPKY